jgi:hypothetical protein
VNLVLAGSRVAAKPGETVDVLDGGFLGVTRSYPAAANEDPRHDPASCQE